jgi:predicted DNA-binding ribbon-helix-helix protein
MNSTLVNRNVIIGGHRTSIRLEMEMWEALDEICRREGMVPNTLCSMIDAARDDTSRTSTIRSFIVRYFRCIDTPGGRVGNALQMAMGFGRLRSIGMGRSFAPVAGMAPSTRMPAAGD